jgi:hypothetical protein
MHSRLKLGAPKPPRNCASAAAVTSAVFPVAVLLSSLPCNGLGNLAALL